MDKPSSSGPTSRSKRPLNQAQLDGLAKGRDPTRAAARLRAYNAKAVANGTKNKNHPGGALAIARAVMRAKREADPLSAKQKLMVNEYLIDLNVEQAAKRAGYKSARKVMRTPHVMEALRRVAAKRTMRAQLTAEKVLHELANIGFCNIGDLLQDDGTPKPISELTRAQTAAISEITIDQYMEGRGDDAVPVKRTKFKLMDKRQALVDLGKHMGMFVERKEFGRPGDFAALDSKKLEQALYDEYLALGVSAVKARALVEAASGPESSAGEGEPREEAD